MSDEDDDLPVLTQVLRIGGGRAVVAGDAHAFSESPPDEIPPNDELVIGSEPHHESAPDASPTIAVDAVARDRESTADSATHATIEHATHSTADPTVHVIEPAAHATTEPTAHSMPEHASLQATSPLIVPFMDPVDTSPSRPEIALTDASARVREAVLNDLSARIDTELDARIAQTLRAELETALGSLQVKLREELADAMRDVVRRAVDEELARQRDLRSE